ncbi:hypothetical protein [Nannocystis exedens]|uniref:hypothetical protein n=1 Tax=Nannocystis exedens TaxID=54 RepID=UPI0011607BA7|nr:hypothetical protein [Nannocystis exedens]
MTTAAFAERAWTCPLGAARVQRVAAARESARAAALLVLAVMHRDTAALIDLRRDRRQLGALGGVEGAAEGLFRVAVANREGEGRGRGAGRAQVRGNAAPLFPAFAAYFSSS